MMTRKEMGYVLLLAAVLVLLPSLVFGGENCASMGGVCRDRCGRNEEALEGAFIDCDDKQECCAGKTGGAGTREETPKVGAPPQEPVRDKDVR